MIRPSWTERNLRHQSVPKSSPEDRTTLLFQLQTCSCWNQRCFVPECSVVSEYVLEDACIGYIQNIRRHFWPKFIGIPEMEFKKKASPTLITTSEQMAMYSANALRTNFQFNISWCQLMAVATLYPISTHHVSLPWILQLDAFHFTSYTSLTFILPS